MKNKGFSSGLSVMLTILLATTLFVPVKAYGATAFSDVKGHWAETYINRAVNQGFITGYTNGTFKPNNNVTRAEFVSMINRALGNSGTTRITFSDVNATKWFYQDVAKAVRAGYATGSNDGTFKPDQSITRQEAAVMIAKIVPTYGYSGRLQVFPDYGKVSTWAYDSLSRVNGKGYIGGYSDGKIHPLDPLTRAQAAKIIGDILINESIASSDPVVKKDGTKLSGTIYPNNVTIHRDLGEGDATVDNCVILGTFDLQGGGTGTITVNNSRVVAAAVNRTAAPVRLLAKGETAIGKTTGINTFILQTSALAGGTFGPGFERISVADSANATLRGTFPMVSIDGSYAKLKLETGTINDLTVAAGGRRSDITAESGTTIKSASVNSESYFHGTGTISNMLVYAKNITYETKPRTWTIGTGGSTPTLANPVLAIAFSPKNAETGVYLDNKITITFSTAMKKYDGTTLVSGDIEDIVTLRKGSSSGTSVPYTATIDSAKKVVTITPSSNLSASTKYYVRVKADMMRDAYGNYNEEANSYFTTGDTTLKLTTSFSPENGATGIPVDRGSITISFSDKITRYDGNDFSSTSDRYLRDSVVLFQKSGTAMNTNDYSVAINSTRRTITITLNKNLDLNTKYTVGIRSSSLKTVGGTAVSSTNVSWTTAGAPALSSGTTVSYERAIDFIATPNVNGTLYAVALPSSATAPGAGAIKAGKDASGNAATAAASSAVTASTPKTLNLSGLSTDTSYKVYAVLYDGNNNASGVMILDKKTLPLLLNSLTVTPAGEGADNVLTDFSPENMSYTCIVPSGTTAVSVTAAANADTFVGTLSINGDTNSGSVQVSLENGDADVTVILEESGKTAVTYTVVVEEAGSAELDSMMIKATEGAIGTNYEPGTGTKYDLEASDTTSVMVKIVPEDLDATITCGGNSIPVGTFSTLNFGKAAESISFTITAADRSSSETYTILFSRPVPTTEPSP